jgi:predicted flavoprotein YhiN
VSRGGIVADELEVQTLESKKVPGLYFIGEVVDITGELGGYNFQWAFSSAYVCAKAIK